MLHELSVWLIPDYVHRLYASDVGRGILARSLTGTMLAGMVLASVIVLLLIFRSRIREFIYRVNGPRFFLFVLASLALLSLPDPVFPVRPGLDYSWQWMLNRLAFSHEWGNSVVFTYGPLGWLLYPFGRWSTVLVALVANLLFCGLWVWGVWRIYCLSENGRIEAWCLAMTMLFPQMSMEWRWTMLAIVLARTSWFAAGIVSAVLAFMKFSSVVTCVGTQVFMLVLDRRRRIVHYLTGFAVVFLLLVAVLFPSPAAFWKWMYGSIQIAVGYNRHMILDKNALVLSFPIMAFLALVHRPRHFIAILPFSPLLYCAAKYNWVRQGIEPFLYSLTVVSAFLAGRFVLHRRCFVLTAAVFILIGYGMLWPFFFAAGSTYVAFPFGLNPMGLVRTILLPSTISKAESRARTLLAGSELPRRFRATISTGTVQLLPHEFAPAMVDPTLHLLPYATMQMYSTYTAYLDEMAASSYRMESAPDFIVIHTAYLAIDGKNAFLDCPRTWASIRAHYKLCDSDGDYVLLSRRREPIQIICDRRIVLAEESLFERMRSTFFRAKLHFAQIETSDGKILTCRVNPDVLKEPIDRDLPLDAAGIAEYFRQ